MTKPTEVSVIAVNHKTGTTEITTNNADMKKRLIRANAVLVKEDELTGNSVFKSTDKIVGIRTQ